MNESTASMAPVKSFFPLERRKNGRSIRAEMRRIAQETRRLAARYGDTPGEQESRKRLVDRAKQLQREAYWSGQGRRMDLPLLLRQRRADGRPVWCLIDYTYPIGSTFAEAKHDRNGCYFPAMRWSGRDGERPAGFYVAASHMLSWTSCCVVPLELPGIESGLAPAGVPPVPRKADRIARSPRIRGRANWVGLLFQPDEWTERRPDPAIVVEWSALPGQYYALAVWGGDYHRIMEFVD